MARRIFTVDRYKEIERRLAEGRGLREIARALGCSRRLVREVRDGRGSPDTPKPGVDPLWMSQLDWPLLIHDLSLGHPLKYLWEEKAQHLTSYSNFLKQLYRKFPELRRASVTAREFSAGERIECDYAGKTLEWVDLTDGVLHQAYVFISVLGFSQLLFAWAAEDMKSRNWLSCHRRMFEAYGGVAHVTVPDCLKQGVTKCHIYDPDLNPAYAQLASHYSTAIVPARPGRPKDKGLAENAVNLVMRYVHFRYRRRRFTSLAEINDALADCIERINDRKHSRFGISRRERFEQCERSALKPLPADPFEVAEWKEATLHADCYVQVEAVYYSAPHIHRHKRLRVKLTETQVEIFLKLERLAIHPRSRHRDGRRISNSEHFPANSQAYYEATPQKLLSQARFVHADLHQLLVELFNADVYGHLRRAQGLVRSSAKELDAAGRELASARIVGAIATMRRYNKVRVPYFQALLAQARKAPIVPNAEREIIRRAGNPMLRYAGGAAVSAAPSVNVTSPQEK
jgi:transposase